MCVLVAQSSPTLCNSMDHSLPGSSIHGIFLARELQYWSGLPCPYPGSLLDPGMEPASPAAQVDSLLLSYQEKLIF